MREWNPSLVILNGVLQDDKTSWPESIQKAEDLELFKQAIQRIGLKVAPSGSIVSREEALQLIEEIGFPAIVRPSFTLGGAGGNIAYNREEFEAHIDW